MIQGRPRSISKAKNRQHTITLSIEAENICRDIRRTKKDYRCWLNSYVSERIIHDFRSDDLRHNVVLNELLELQDRQKKLEMDIQERVILLREIRTKKNNK